MHVMLSEQRSISQGESKSPLFVLILQSSATCLEKCSKTAKSRSEKCNETPKSRWKNYEQNPKVVGKITANLHISLKINTFAISNKNKHYVKEKN